MTITKREGLRERDVKYTMRVARKRFKEERASKIPFAMHGFRVWARKSYNAFACYGKLIAVVRN